MTNLERMITELCPDGVKYAKLSEVATITRGVRLIRSQLAEAGKYPVYQNSMTALGYYEENNYPANTVFVISAGAAGEIGYSTVDFWAADDCFCFACPEDLQNRYLYYALLCQQNYIFSRVRRASVPRLARSVVEQLRIPVPPLPVQNEIVRILDNFTALTAELTAELTARRKQYEYYRDALLTFGDDVPMVTLGEIAEYRRGSFPQPYGERRWYDGDNAMPFVQVADVAEEGMRLVENTKQRISVLAQPMSVFVPKGTVVVSLQGSIGRVAITQYDSYVDRTLAIFNKYRIVINKKYFAYQLERKFGIEKEFARGSTLKTITKEEFTKFTIPIPLLEEQERIVSILDRFDALTTDISNGLPAEITARQKQYEYYRDKLLTFKEQKR